MFEVRQMMEMGEMGRYCENRTKRPSHPWCVETRRQIHTYHNYTHNSEWLGYQSAVCLNYVSNSNTEGGGGGVVLRGVGFFSLVLFFI